MAIKNRDGTLYSFSKPNHLMLEQTLWTRNEKYIIHNRFGQISFRNDNVQIKQEETPELKVTPKVAENPSAIEVWCLPARSEEVIDPLYAEKHIKITYGEKFKFDATVEFHNDLQLVLRTYCSVVTEGSVIFPRTNDKRWWRVYLVSYKNDVYRIKASISDYHPDFSQ